MNSGAAAVMPLASPRGSNRGLASKEFIQILINEIDIPVIVDAGLGRPSQACEAMEMGAAAIMSNTALAWALSAHICVMMVISLWVLIWGAWDTTKRRYSRHKGGK